MNEQVQEALRWRVRLVDLAGWREAFEVDPTCTLVDDPSAPVDVELQTTPAPDSPRERREVVVRASAELDETQELPALSLSLETPPATVVAVCRAVCALWRESRAAQRMVRALGERLQRAEDDARRDYSTGLLNRRGWHERLTLVERSGEADAWSVGLLDLDDFKFINDAHGLAAGDAALQAVARALAGEQQGGEAAARWGGDEFVVAVPGSDAAHAARRFAAYQSAASSADVGIEGVRVKASLGWAGPLRRAPDEGPADAPTLARRIAQLLEQAESRLRDSRKIAQDARRKIR